MGTLVKYNTMKNKEFIYCLALFMLVMFFMGCSEDSITDKDTDNGYITLEVSAFPAIGDNTLSRTGYVDNGEIMKTSWMLNDVIYIGSTEGSESEMTMTQLLEKGNFITFICSSIDNSTGKAQFQGTSVPEGANLAIYGNKDILVTTDNQGFIYKLDNLTQSSGAPSSLAETDFLCAKFSDGTIGTFNRGLALLKLDLNGIPYGMILDKMSLIVNDENQQTNTILSSNVMIDKDGVFQSKGGDRKEVLRYFNTELTPNDNGELSVYTFITPSTNFSDARKMSFVFTDKNNKANQIVYSKEISGKNISSNSAINISLNAPEKALVLADNDTEGLSPYVELPKDGIYKETLKYSSNESAWIGTWKGNFDNPVPANPTNSLGWYVGSNNAFYIDIDLIDKSKTFNLDQWNSISFDVCALNNDFETYGLEFFNVSDAGETRIAHYHLWNENDTNIIADPKVWYTYTIDFNDSKITWENADKFNIVNRLRLYVNMWRNLGGFVYIDNIKLTKTSN